MLRDESILENFNLVETLTDEKGEKMSGGACQAFYPPRYNGLPVDRCAYTGPGPVDCRMEAAQFAARTFCQKKGFKGSRRAWWRDKDKKVNNYIAVARSDGKNEFRPHRGAFNFELILCT